MIHHRSTKHTSNTHLNDDSVLKNTNTEDSGYIIMCLYLPIVPGPFSNAPLHVDGILHNRRVVPQGYPQLYTTHIQLVDQHPSTNHHYSSQYWSHITQLYVETSSVSISNTILSQDIALCCVQYDSFW